MTAPNNHLLAEGEEHIYFSTACQHGQHDYCGSRYNAYTLEEKKPATCKYCDAQCVCGCHSGTLITFKQ